MAFPLKALNKANSVIDNFSRVHKKEETDIDTLEKFNHFDNIKNSSNKI